MNNKGLDHLGYITNTCAIDNIQTEFLKVVDEVVVLLTEQLAGKLHSIYLYGSVGRGNAIVGKSDLDVSVVFKEVMSPSDREILKTLSMSVPKDNPVISKFDIDPGDVREILNIREKYRWQFWLKHCCCCIWGEDLSKGFERLKPNLKIALELNNDLATFIEDLDGTYFLHNSSGLAKTVAKKILRTAYLLVAQKDGSWYTDLEQCAKVVMHFYPEDKHNIQLACHMLNKQEMVSREQVLALYNGFGLKLVKQIQRLESQ